MNTSIKKKVNTIGLIAKIVSIVLIVCMGLGCLGTLVGAVFCAAIPDDWFTLGVSTDVDFTMGKSLFREHFAELTQELIEKANAELHSTSPGNPFEFERTEEGVIMSGSVERMTFNLSDLAPVLLGAFLRCACLLVVFIFLLRLADAFRTCDNPFEERIIKRMMTFAWVLLGCAVLMGVSFSGAFSISGPAIVSGFGRLNYSVNLAPIMISLVVLFLAMIFRYGAKLQQEADETL